MKENTRSQTAPGQVLVPYRNPVVVAILGYITFNIYVYYWLISTKNSLNRCGLQHQVPSAWQLASPFIALVLVIVGGALGTPTKDGGQTVGIIPAILLFGGFAAAVYGLYVTFRWVHLLGKAVDEYSASKKYTPLLYAVMVWVFGALGIAIMQDVLNKRSDPA